MPSHHHALTPPSHRACAPTALCTESTSASLYTELASSSFCSPDPLCSALHRTSHHHPLTASHHAPAPPLLLRPNPMPSAPNILPLSAPEPPALCTSHHRQSCPTCPSLHTPPPLLLHRALPLPPGLASCTGLALRPIPLPLPSAHYIHTKKTANTGQNWHH
ncbi:hypothetical protein SLEP1_g15293 [Rubroshorea leprosula]|uniref:Uncharacterized protein n=1 Tax=Rubroshorea leprosula TaxID=152421 RepID=A0AAV5ILX0_9ROSI|nr:hypothetical protein SLEP1_g15293 [Rubroshorea leprosula]